MNDRRDTHDAMDAFQLAGYRRMSPSQKLAIVVDLIQTTRQLALADIRRVHPNASERELQLRLASRYLDAETMKRAFDWDVEAR